MPALLTRISQRPPSFSTVSFSVATLAGLLTSHWTAVAFPPAPAINCSVFSALWRSAMTIRAPSSANRSADAWPMPEAAPEITTVFPSCRLVILRLSVSCRAIVSHITGALVKAGSPKPSEEKGSTDCDQRQGRRGILPPTGIWHQDRLRRAAGADHHRHDQGLYRSLDAARRAAGKPNRSAATPARCRSPARHPRHLLHRDLRGRGHQG